MLTCIFIDYLLPVQSLSDSQIKSQYNAPTEWYNQVYALVGFGHPKYLWKPRQVNKGPCAPDVLRKLHYKPCVWLFCHITKQLLTFINLLLLKVLPHNKTAFSTLLLVCLNRTESNIICTVSKSTPNLYKFPIFSLLINLAAP